VQNPPVVSVIRSPCGNATLRYYDPIDADRQRTARTPVPEVAEVVFFTERFVTAILPL
jgi:hypothetical protein